MNGYYLSLARQQMIKAMIALENADEYIATATRDSPDYSFRKNLRAMKRKLSQELDRSASVLQEPDMSEVE